MANLELVVKELQQERDRLDKAIAVLMSLDGGTPTQVSRSTMSAAARQRISAAQKKRWKNLKTAGNTSQPKRRISAAGIARIRAAAKARWARVKAEKKK
jgi:negative regulator of replication initiation